MIEVDASNISNKVMYQGESNKDEKNSSIKEKLLDSIQIEAKADKLSKEEINYFGYDIFHNDPALFQKSNDAIPNPNHIIAPGDEVIIMIWGQTEINKSYFVSKDGYLFIDNVGQIFVNGITFSDLEKKLFKYLKKVYSSLADSQNATSFLDISLGGSLLRPKRIFALGEIKQPGAYITSPSTTLFSSFFILTVPP